MEGGHHESGFKPIDIREMISKKNPASARKIPSFIYKWLTRILHLKEVNAFMKKNGHLKGTEFTQEAINFLDIKFELIGKENIPKHGRYLFTSNHPLGGLDGIILLNFLNRNVGTTRALVNDFLMTLQPLQEFFIPINKLGGQARESLKKVEELYSSEDQILIFPAGLCSRKIKGKIVDLAWQKHFITKAIQHKLDVIPIFFEGRNTKRFYNLANFRKFLGIKVNIEMMYLSDEMFRHKGKTFKIYFGKPIPYQQFNKSKKPNYWAEQVKETVYNLKEN